MSCDCSCCRVRAGGEPPKLDDCRCPGQVHVNPNCFVSPASEEAKAAKGKTKKVLDLILRYGQIDGDHHKAWVLDQVVRVLTGGGYEDWVKAACDGKDGPETYDWYVGVPP